MFTRSVRAGAAELVALACVLAVGLSGCSSNDDAAADGVGGQADRTSRVTGAMTSSVAIRDNLAQLAADTAGLKEASRTLIAKDTVSDETRSIAEEAEPIFTEQEAQLVKALGVDVDSSEMSLDADTLDRLNNEEGPHADMAYLTLLESNLDALLDRWNEVESVGGKELKDFAAPSRTHLTELKEKLAERMQY